MGGVQNYVNIKGRQFGELFVVRQVDRGEPRGNKWLVRCSCGNKRVLIGSHLNQGRFNSCGIDCPNRPSRRKPYRRIRRVWRNMMDRCYNENHQAYHNYGGRGIRVCKEWHDEDTFVFWVVENLGDPNNPVDFDRINNNKSYTPENVRWATRSQSSRNTRKTKYVTLASGKKIDRYTWMERKARKYGCETPLGILMDRYFKLKWTMKETMSRPFYYRGPVRRRE